LLVVIVALPAVLPVKNRVKPAVVGRDRRVARRGQVLEGRDPAVVGDRGVAGCAKVGEIRDPTVVGRDRRVGGRAKVVEISGPAVVGRDRRDASRARVEEEYGPGIVDDGGVAGRARVKKLCSPAGSKESRCIRGIVDDASADKTESLAGNIKGIGWRPGVELNSADQRGVGESNRGCTRGAEACRSSRHGLWSPIGSGVPDARPRIKDPGGVLGISSPQCG